MLDNTALTLILVVLNVLLCTMAFAVGLYLYFLHHEYTDARVQTRKLEKAYDEYIELKKELEEARAIAELRCKLLGHPDPN